MLAAILSVNPAQPAVDEAQSLGFLEFAKRKRRVAVLQVPFAKVFNEVNARKMTRISQQTSSWKATISFPGIF